MSINDWPQEDRPRERLLKNGEHTLTNSELLAILLGTGVKGESAIALARKILKKYGTFRGIGQLGLRSWKEFKGLGNAKIARMKAAVEIGRRYKEEKLMEKRPKIESSQDIAKFLMPRMQDLKKEVFKAVLLNSENRIIDIIEIEEGSVNLARPIIRRVFEEALMRTASFIICVHNHPSGNPKPSEEDKEFTRTLAQAGETLVLTCLDHIIIGNGNYFSFCDEGLI